MTVTTATQQYQRVVRGLPAVASYTFGLDDDALPGTAATVDVAIVDAAGNAVTSGTATLGDISGGQQTATFALDANLTPARDLFTATWTVEGDNYNVVSLIDVCDQRLFPLSDYAQFSELAQFDASQLETQRLMAEAFLERECGRAFTGRYGTEQIVLPGGHWVGWGGSGGWGDGWRRNRGRGELTLRQPDAKVLRSITRTWTNSNGEVETYAVSLDYAELDPFSSTIYYRADRSSSQYDGLWGDLTIAYEYGEWLADVRRICLILARYRLIQGPVERRAVSMPVEGGGTIQLLTPGMSASVTGIPEVDRFIQRYNARTSGFISGL